MTSDELLFKGTVNRRLGRELAREASRNHIRPPAREPAQDLGRDASHENPRQTEWKYRGRSDTEAVSVEPIPAPSGVSAQRSEGFQRFYKAVVSPTHVRVTAGGRIVPNTRGPPSPTSRRTTDSPATSQSMPEKTVPSKPSVGPINLGQPVSMVPQFIPGYAPGFQPIQPGTPVSFVPMAFGAQLPPGFAVAQPAVNHHGVTMHAADSILKDVHNTKPTEARHEAYATDNQQGNLKISPPELFDGTKPYYYNGQIIYPVGALPASLGHPMVPVPVVGIPNGVPVGIPNGVPHGGPVGIMSQPPGQYMQTRASSTGSAATGTTNTPSSTRLSGVPPVVNHIVPANANFNAAKAPPISSIKLSDITKKQIASFKQSLKYHEDQLQYNRHQIDEKEMEMRIQTFKNHIQRFEATLKAQLEFEEAQRKASQAKEDKKPAQSSTDSEEKKASAQRAASPVRGSPEESGEAVRRRVAMASCGLNTNIGEGGKAVFRCPIEPDDCSDANDPSKGLSLPSDAALAPVFQPRSFSSSWGASENGRERDSQEEAEKLLAADSRAVNHGGAIEQRSMSHSFTTPYLAVLPHTEGNFNAYGNTDSLSGDSVRSASAKHGHGKSNLGVPYLLGTLPKGVNPRTARDQDYVYNRPLTEEERRARFLYWGKAPKSAVKGLPKFDGKHFYPPSPVKERAAGQIREAEAGGSPGGHRELDHRKMGFSDGDPFRPMTPVERTDLKGTTAREENCPVGLSRTVSFETQVNGGSEDLQVGGNACFKYSESSTDASSVGSADRRSEKSGYDNCFARYDENAMADFLAQREALAGRPEEGPDKQRTVVDDRPRRPPAVCRTRGGIIGPIAQHEPGSACQRRVAGKVFRCH